MPFGLSNAPAVFQSFINHVFFDLLDNFVIVLLDDILIFSNNERDHKIHVRQVLERLQKHHLYAKLEKCEFNQPRIEFLGFIISAKGIEVAPSKVEAVVEWPAPSNRKKL